MAPNVPPKETWAGSDETSLEVQLPVAPVPEVFLPHLPQHFQDPDSPNLHILQHHDANRSTQKPTIKNQTTRSTLRAFKPPTVAASHARVDEALQPSRVSVLDEVTQAGRRTTGNTHLRPQHGAPAAAAAAAAGQDSTGASALPHRGGPRVPESLHHPRFIPSVPVPPNNRERHPVEPRREVAGLAPNTRNKGRETTTTRRPAPTTTRSHRLDPGVLKLPGHEPEAPADLVLIHHDRAIDTRNQSGINGIFVRDDSTNITSEAATALILVGICIVFLVFICFIMFVKKIRRQRIERKVKQSGDVIKPQTTYESTNSTMHPNPLSLLPPAILHALAIATARHDDPSLPSFLTMEPEKNGNSLGRLWFSVCYDYVQSNLVLRVMHARYTKGRGSSNNPGEVWVEACVLTSMNTIEASTKTGTRRASSAPVFNQTFRFQVADDEVTQYLLRLTMYDRHPQNGEKAVGAVIVPLSTVDLCSDATLSRDLQ